MASKSVFLSKSFWYAFVSGLLIALLPAFPVLKPVADWVAGNSILLGSVWGVLGVVIRLVTKDAVHLVE